MKQYKIVTKDEIRNSDKRKKKRDIYQIKNNDALSQNFRQHRNKFRF